MEQAVATELTELEGAALTVVRQLGPCTAYRLKRVFEQSPSEVWSGSAGAVYPLVRRLVERGYLEQGPIATGGRGRPGRTLALTDAGLEAASIWFSDVHRAAGFGFDPLRTRLSFKSAVAAADYEEMIVGVTAELERLHANPQVPPDDDEEWSKALQRLWLESRLEWLRRARDEGLI
ncbi:MAG: hypothetical protein GKS06_09835 [Acidobacteria bacterium]|nr:hypothetical protein [Acidobacteriota bacterium]